MRRHFENCAAPTERSTAFASVRIDSTRFVSFLVSYRSFGVWFCLRDLFRYVAFRLIVYSFVPSFVSSVRVDSIIIETNLNFYEYERALRVGGWRVWGSRRGRYYVS